MGFAAGDNTVTISRYTGGSVLSSVSGSTPEEMMPYLADGVARLIAWQIMFTVGMAVGDAAAAAGAQPDPRRDDRARRAQQAGRAAVALRARAHSGVPVRALHARLDEPAARAATLHDLVRRGRAAAVFAESDDPERLVPVVGKAEDIMIAVSGDPLRTNAYVFAHNGILGYTTTKPVRLPAR